MVRSHHSPAQESQMMRRIKRKDKDDKELILPLSSYKNLSKHLPEIGEYIKLLIVIPIKQILIKNRLVY